MKFFHNIYIASLVLLLSIGIFGYSIYNYYFSSISNDNSINALVIEPGTIDDIGESLEKNGYIRSKLAFKLYIKLTGKSNLKAGTYNLSKNMNISELVDILNKGGTCGDVVKITFKEGLNIRQIASIIEENTNNKKEDVYNLISDQKYLNSLIDKFWFICDDILIKDIYYALEGYLYPSTYHYCTKDVSVELIFKSMLDEMSKQLEVYKKEIDNSKYNLHELLTIASIVELEGTNLENRKGIASVFYNRLDKGMSLGSDVTTYYGLRLNVGEIYHNNLDLNTCNNYNTRCSSFTKLPISPICNPSVESIIATLNPDTSKYYYFVADKNGKIYFGKNLSEHNNIIARLKNKGLWY